MKKKVLFVLLSSVFATIPASTVLAADITVTVPYFGDEEENTDIPDSKASVVNPDGSTSYTLDDKQQEEWKKYLSSSFSDSVKDILDDDTNYPNIEDISYNDEMTEFNITFSSADLAPSEYFVEFIPFFVAPVYQQVNGISEEDVDYTIKTLDSSSGSGRTITYEECKSDWESFAASTGISYSGNTSSKGSTEEKTKKISFSSDSSSLEYSGFETMPYEEGSQDTLGVVKFKFTNKTDSPDYAPSFYDIKAYQNGIELSGYMGMGNTVCDNTYKTVLKDTSIEVGFAFMLQDTESPITVYAYDGFMSDAPYQIQEIEIK